MTKEELIQFLKENLKLEVYFDEDGCHDRQINIDLYLGEELITKATEYI